MKSWRRLGLGGSACTLGAVALVWVGPMGAERGRWLLVMSLAWAVFGFVAWWVLRTPAPSAGRARRRALAGVVLFAGLAQLPGLTSVPLSSTDAYRYVWDGRVQLAGVSPYRYAPGDDALTALRDPILFPGLPAGVAGGLGTVRNLPSDPAARGELLRNDVRTRINRPRVVTIYPPAAQAYFLVVAALTPPTAGTFGLQIAAALLSVLTTAVIGAVAGRRGDPRWALLWGWAPITAHEAGNNAHVDVVVATAIVAAMAALTWRSGRLARSAGGVALGFAVAAKLLPLALLPAVVPLRHRRPAVIAVVAVLTAVAFYVPYLAGTGRLVFGYLTGYLGETGLDTGTGGFAVLAALQVPGPLRAPAAALILLLAAVAVAWRTDPHRPWNGAVLLYGLTLLVLTPIYPWYALPVVALAALARRPEWLLVALPGAVVNSVGPPSWVVLVVWSGAAALILAATAARAGRAPGLDLPLNTT